MTFSNFAASWSKTATGASTAPAARLHFRWVMGVIAASCIVSIGCGDDGGGTATNEPNETNEPGGLSAIESQLSKCPTVQMTSDPTASACIEGTYTGKTFSGEACSLTIGEVGAYTFTSPTLSVTSTPKDDTIFVFGHNLVSSFGQLTWMVSDPIATEAFYDLEFTARYGEMVPANDRKIEIEVQRNDADSMASVTCTVNY